MLGGHSQHKVIYGCHTCVKIAIYVLKTKFSILFCTRLYVLSAIKTEKKISILALKYIFMVQNRVFLCESKRESRSINQLYIKLKGISYIIYKWNCYITNDLMGCNGPASKEYHDVPTYLCCTQQMHYQRPIVEFPGSKS